MTSHVKLRRDRIGLIDYETQIKEMRCQLVDQLKVFDLQLEQKSQQLQDLMDYVRRRGEIESEYARSLEKLADRFTSRIKRKEPSSNTVAQVWVALLSQTRQESGDHSRLSETCSNTLIQPLTQCLEYTQRLAKKSKDICMQLQDGLLKVTIEMQTAWRTYYQYHSDYVCADGKLKEAEKQEEKQKQSAAKKLERLIEKRQEKVKETYLKSSKARNEYLLKLGASNATMKNFYLQDISTLIDCADVGYHLSLGQVMQAYLSSHWRTQQNLGTGLQQLQGTVSGLAQCRDRDTLLQEHFNTFCMPLCFPYQPHDGDQVSEVNFECELSCELETRFKQIQTRLKAVSMETEERVKEYVVGRSLVSKLQARHDQLKAAVEKGITSSLYIRKNYSTSSIKHNHKLFYGDLLSFIQASGQQIPVVVQSCVCFINLNGLHHEGIFRVPGSQMEINNLRDAFERGEDPLSERPYDLDSVAGVLKLYFRTLEKPLFPSESNSQLLEHAQIKGETERAAQLKITISSYPGPVVIVMRYLFAFLHHVSQYSDENMMQPYNLAVCFGPSLVRAAQNDDDAVTLQPLINALVKNIIVQQENIFPSQSELQGPVYEECMTLEQPLGLMIYFSLVHVLFNYVLAELETTHPTNSSSSSSSTANAEKKTEGSRVNVGCSVIQSKSAAAPKGGSTAAGGKFMLQFPPSHQYIPRRVHNPGNMGRE
uniref:Rho GTPase activating protein 4a n=1 Tax=Takifugu rubripes TaxID=31033 RepID=H2UQB1_TAKRU